MRLSTQNKTLKLLTLFLILIGIFLFFNFTAQVKRALRSNLSKRLRHSLFASSESCKPVHNVAYLKTHRTASSAIQGILFRYGLKNKLHFALPRTDNYFGKTQTFNRDMIPSEIVGDLPINIFAIHTKWNFEEIRAVMPPDTVYIASVREPISQFESLFTYANFENKSGLKFDQYVYYTPTNAHRMFNFLGFNQMSWDFGLSEEDMYDKSAVQWLIEEADENFDLVLVAEKLEESLILLKHLLCWNYDDMVTFKVNARQDKFKINLNKTITEQLQERLYSDVRLYDHFRQKLEDSLSEFGKERMEQEIKELHKSATKIRKYCNLTESRPENLIPNVNRPFSEKVMGYKGNMRNDKCYNFIVNENEMIERTRRKQAVDVIRKFGKRRTNITIRGAIMLSDYGAQGKKNKLYLR